MLSVVQSCRLIPRNDVVQRVQAIEVTLDVLPIEVDILPCHVQCRMPKDGLKLDHAAARHDVVLGERMSEQVKGSLRHVSSNVEVAHSGFQSVNSHLAVAGSGEEVVFVLPMDELYDCIIDY